MDEKKNLLRTSNTRLYQGESFGDKIQFIFPKTYEDQALKDFVFTLIWFDPNEVSHADILVLKEDNYKDNYLKFTIPVDATLTKTAGFYVVKVNIMKMLDNGTQEVFIQTSSNSFSVTSASDLDPASSSAGVQVDILSQKVDELTKTVNNTATKKADGFNILADGKAIQLTSEGSPIGSPIPLDTLFKAQEGAMDNEVFKVTEL